MMAAFPARALAEIDGLHRVLQAWFRAEGEPDPDLVLRHFDPGFTMVTTTGTLLPYEAFRAGLPALRGSRPGLVMSISGETLRHGGPGFALLTYQERQAQGGTVTDRFSTVLMLDRAETAGPAWRHLHETMLA